MGSQACVRVLQINSVCGKGSTGKLAVQISDVLTENGVENYIAYGYGTTTASNAFRFSAMWEAHLHSFLSRRFCKQGYGSVLATRKLIRWMKKHKPRVVHLHNIHGHYLNFKMLFGYLNRTDIEVIWTFHDCWPVTGKCTHFTTAGCNKWKTQCENCPQLSTYPDSVTDRSRKNYSDKKTYFTENKRMHIVTVSEWLRGVAEQSFFGGKADVRCIYNGINTEVFTPSESDLRARLGLTDKFVVLGVSSVWKDAKGLGEFIKLAETADPQMAVVLVGVSEEQKRTLPASIIGVTAVSDQKELARYYSMADVLVNLSAEETFGLVVAEALACGTPAVVVNSTACPEVVDETTGLVIAAGTADCARPALEEIRRRGKAAYTEACVARARRLFSNERMQQEYLNLYRGIMKP